MNLKYLYTGGTSVTKGGGLENIEHRNDIRPLYKEKFGIDLPPQEECSYPFHLAEILDLTLINDAKSGSGVDRLVRRTHKWIHENRDKVKDTLFWFEFQPGLRLDMYLPRENHHAIMNAHVDEKGVWHHSLVKEWWVTDKYNDKLWNKYKKHSDSYLENFFDEEVHYHREMNLIETFLTYCESMGLNYFFTISGGYHDVYRSIRDKSEIRRLDTFKKIYNRCLNKSLPGNIDVWQYAHLDNRLILDVIDHNDNHIDYFSNKFFAKLIFDFIRQHSDFTKLTPNKTKNNSLNIKYWWEKSDIDETILESTLNFSDYITFTYSDIESADCILLGEASENVDGGSYHADIDLMSIKNALLPIKSHLKDKKILWVQKQEILSSEGEEEVKNLLVDEFEVDLNNFHIIDVRIDRKLPLGLIIKGYGDNIEHWRGTQDSKKSLPLNVYYHDDLKCKTTLEQITPIHYKFSFLINKANPIRLLTLDTFLNSYGIENVTELKDGIVTMKNIHGNDDVVDSIDLDDIEGVLKNCNITDISFSNKQLLHDLLGRDISHYNIDGRYSDDGYKDVIKALRTSAVNIVGETWNYGGFSPITPTDLQLSEKTILSILSGNFTYIIKEGEFYQRLEDDYGFDFSYLKKVFGIDYRNLNEKTKITEVDKIAKVVKNTTMSDLDNLLNQWHETMVTNILKVYSAMIIDENEINFFKQFVK